MFKIRTIFVHGERLPTNFGNLGLWLDISAILADARTTVQDENAIDLESVEEAQSQATPLNQPTFVD
jgi:hypothetical protein